MAYRGSRIFGAPASLVDHRESRRSGDVSGRAQVIVLSGRPSRCFSPVARLSRRGDVVDFGGVACHARARLFFSRNVFAISPHVVVSRSHIEVVSGIKKISLFSFCIHLFVSVRPLLIDSDVTVSTLGQKSSRVLGEK